MDAEIRRKMDSTVRNYVLSEQFWKMLDLITKFLEPMVVALIHGTPMNDSKLLYKVGEN